MSSAWKTLGELTRATGFVDLAWWEVSGPKKECSLTIELNLGLFSLELIVFPDEQDQNAK